MLKHSDIEMISLNGISFFSSLKSKTLKMFLVLITAMLVVGCIEVKHDIQLNNDESGEISIELLIKPSYTTIALPEIDKRIKNHPSKDWQVSHNGKVDGKEQVIITKSFQNISELSDNHTSFALNVNPTDDGKKRYSLEIKQLASSEGRSPFEYLVKMPGELTESNGKNMTANEVLWRFKGVRRGQKMTASAIGSAGFSFGFSGITSGLDNLFNALFLKNGIEYKKMSECDGADCYYFRFKDNTALTTECDSGSNFDKCNIYQLKNGSKTKVNMLGAESLALIHVSKNGQVVTGLGKFSDGEYHIVRWDNERISPTGTGTLSDLGKIGGDKVNIYGALVSDDGSILYSKSINGRFEQFYWKNGNIFNLSKPSRSNWQPSTNGDALVSSDNKGNLVYWKNGEITRIAGLGGRTRALYISDDGTTVLGDSGVKKGQTHMVYWRYGDEKITDLGALSSHAGGIIEKSTNTSIVIGNRGHGKVVANQYKHISNGYFFKKGIGDFELSIDKTVDTQAMTLSENGVWIGGTENKKPVFWKIDEEINVQKIDLSLELGGTRYFSIEKTNNGVISGFYAKRNGDINFFQAQDGQVIKDKKISNIITDPAFYHVEFGYINGINNDDGIIDITSTSKDNLDQNAFIINYKKAKHSYISPIKIVGFPVATARTIYYSIVSLISAILFGLLGFKLYKWMQNRPRPAFASSNQAIFCTSCGKPQKAGVVFCTSCGEKQES